ncbi:MAG: beta-glucosidase [Saprospiraceae bacterium]|nr:beta-glucosidase [Saprospiraceae bacterium]
MNLFPKSFTWGSATSSYQIEGAAFEGGKGPSIWDAFCTIPGKTHQGDNGSVACDHYHRFRTDIELMKAMNLPAYRFSISWPRILPSGRGIPSREGIAFYSELIDALLEAGIEPWVTLYHWDLPLALQFEKDGWLGEELPRLFADYAEVCFSHYGDRVKHWITLNEPWVVAMLGYGQGIFAPGRISNSDPYRAGHQLLLAHAQAVERYRSKYQPSQGGVIGITNNCDWREPLTTSHQDRLAAQRALEFFLGWFADPIYHGDYPESMRSRVGRRLPEISATDRDLLTGSSDFFGLNHYTTMLAAEANQNTSSQVYGNGGLSEDQDVALSVDPDWQMTEMGWAIVPWGCRKLLQWIDDRYQHPEIVITENGCAFNDECIEGMVEDQQRIDFIRGYLTEVHQAINQGVNVTGYFAWSFMDNFEWALGYSKRFGLHHVDFTTQQRIPKASAKWYREVIRNHGFDPT